MSGLTSVWLQVHQNPNAQLSDGGVCYGDSGSPMFVPATSLVAAASTAWLTGVPCNAIGGGYRLDTQWAREFLGE